LTGFDPATAPIEVLAPHFDLYDPIHGTRLWDVLDYARDHCPVLRTDAAPGYYIVTRYDDVRTVAEDAASYSSAEPGLLGTPIRMPPVTEDPPTHAEYRRQLNPYFARTALAKFEAGMRSDAATLVKAVSATGRMEFMNDFAIAITARNLAKVVLDEHDEERLHRAVEAVSRISSEGTPEAFMDTAAVAEEFLRDRAATEAANASGSKSGTSSDHNSDHSDVLSAIVTATVEGRPLTMEEQVGVVVVLFLGGLDTTKATLGNMMRHLIEQPDLEAQLRDTAWRNENLDEFLRYETPVTFQARTVTRDTELNGCPLKAGDRLALHFASAFARLQIEIAWDALLDQLTNFRLAAGEHVEMARGVVLTPERLMIEFDYR
jgi:cytochrome P450